MKFLTKLGLGIALAVLVPVTASAQSASPTAIMIANINLAAPNPQVSASSITGVYTLTGKMGEENNINVGVVAYDEKGGIVDTALLKNGITVREGENVSFPFSYTVPSYLSGKIMFSLRAENAAGLPLGVAKLGDETLSGTSPLTCSLSDPKKPTISCTAAEAVTAHISYSAGAIFGPDVLLSTRSFKKGETYTVTPTLSPGKYFTHIGTDVDRGIAIPFAMPGAYGKIVSLVVNKTSQGANATALIRTTESDTILVLVLKDKNGATCGTGSAKVSQDVVMLPLNVTCTEGTVNASLVTKDNSKKLDGLSENFSILPYVAPSSESGNSSSMSYGWYVIIALLVVVLLAYFIISERSAGPVVAAVLFAMFLGGNSAHAATYSLVFTSGSCQACGITVTTSTDKSSYSPGSTAVATMLMVGDDNVQYTSGVGPVGKFGTSIDSTSYSADIYPKATYSQAEMWAGITAPQNVSIPSGTSAGTHFVNSLANSSGYGTQTGSDSITVAAAPTVNVQFSFLQKLLGVFAAENK